jgi:nitrogen fixation protein FixH
MSDFNTQPDRGKPLTGRKVLAITVCAFAVIIGVNLTLAFKAVSTFPGLEVANSYVASQGFDAERTAQVGLGWDLAVQADARRITLALTGADGAAVVPATLEVKLGRSTEVSDDQTPAFVLSNGVYAADVDLHPGKWVMWIKASANNGTQYEKRVSLFVKG